VAVGAVADRGFLRRGARKTRKPFGVGLGREGVGRIDAKTGKIAPYPTPTKGSGPRRGMIDRNGRL